LKGAPNRKIQERKADLIKELASHPPVDEEKLMSLFSPSSEDPRYLSYLYFSSISLLRKLKTLRYKTLREICAIKDDDTRALSFNSWIKDDANMRLLTDAFPIVFSTNVSSDRLGTGDFMFDLVIMDEAGQCDIAHSLIPIARGKSLLLVGDEDQLKPVVTLDGSINARLRDKYAIGDGYDYISQSILSSMKEADRVSQRVLLRKHFRCGRKIIDYCNQYFYDKKLLFSPTLLPGDVSLRSVDNSTKSDISNVCFEEAYGIVDYIKKSRIHDAVIITPFVNQAHFLNSALQKAGITDIKAQTIHSVQGDEKSTVIISCAISRRSAERTVKWLDSHKEIANVAVSRAKDRLIVFGDKETIERLFPRESAWTQLLLYAASKGETKVETPHLKELSIGKSNGSLNEDEFFETVSQLLSTKRALRLVERNQPAEEIFPKDHALKGSGMEFDQVIFEKSIWGAWRPILALEFDGGEHYFDEARRKADLAKANACQRNGVRLVRLGNDLSKDYEYLKIIIRKYAKKQDQDEAEQIYLF